MDGDGEPESPENRRAGMSRRHFVVGIGATAAVAAGATGLIATGVLPGQTRLREALGLNGPAGVIPEIEPGPRVDGELTSSRREGPTEWALSYPPGATPGDPLPVAVVLHGKGGNHRSAFDELGLDRFLAAAVRDHASPFAIASVDGGDGYWHARDDGSDCGRMVIDDFLPVLDDAGLDLDRLAIAGWSMGGYGSLLLTQRHHKDLGIRAVATMSAALWEDPGAGVDAGAFDDKDQAQAYDVLGGTDAFDGIPLRVDCGANDPFADANRILRSRCAATPDGGLDRGAHTVGYWRRVAPDHIAFLASHLG